MRSGVVATAGSQHLAQAALEKRAFGGVGRECEGGLIRVGGFGAAA
jgi:hypothetical protein